MAGVSSRTHYEVLGVPPTASAGQIRAAHRQLAQLLHPDRQVGASSAERQLAERRMREVNAAWTALSDPDRRRAYDRSLRPPTGPTASGQKRQATPPPPVDPDVDPDEPPMGAASFWLLRRGPIVAALVVAAVLFLGTALAGGRSSGRNGETAERPPPLAADSDCVTRQSDGSLRTVGCEYAHTAVIELAGVSAPQACRDGETFARLNTNEGVCLRTLPGWSDGP